MMKRDTPTDPALLKMFGWCLILIALPYTWYAFSRAHAKIDSFNWPAVSAEVLSSSMYQRTGKRTDWCVKVSYRYTVEGKVFIRHHAGVSALGNAACDYDKAAIEQRLRLLSPGATVQAYYDAAAPDHAAIYLVGLDLADYALCMTSPLFLFAGLVAVRSARKIKPQ